MNSWKTTVLGAIAGIALIFGELRDLTDTDPSTVFEWANIVAGLGLLGFGAAAADHKKDSPK